MSDPMYGDLVRDNFVPDLSLEAAAERSQELQRWLLRIQSDEPTLIRDSEEYHGTFNQARGRLYVLVRRTSYMTEGPNREVRWSLEAWNPKRASWETVVQGKSRLREGSAAWLWRGAIRVRNSALINVSTRLGMAVNGAVSVAITTLTGARDAARLPIIRRLHAMTATPKHNLTIQPNCHSLCVRITCHECQDPEPDTVSYVWRDVAGDVYFDGESAEHLILFLAHHDAFELTKPESCGNARTKFQANAKRAEAHEIAGY